MKKLMYLFALTVITFSCSKEETTEALDQAEIEKLESLEADRKAYDTIEIDEIAYTVDEVYNNAALYNKYMVAYNFIETDRALQVLSRADFEAYIEEAKKPIMDVTKDRCDFEQQYAKILLTFYKSINFGGYIMFSKVYNFDRYGYKQSKETFNRKYKWRYNNEFGSYRLDYIKQSGSGIFSEGVDDHGFEHHSIEEDDVKLTLYTGFDYKGRVHTITQKHGITYGNSKNLKFPGKDSFNNKISSFKIAIQPVERAFTDGSCR